MDNSEIHNSAAVQSLFVGVDIGGTGLRISKTAYDDDSGRLHIPDNRSFEGASERPIMITEQGETLFAFRTLDDFCRQHVGQRGSSRFVHQPLYVIEEDLSSRGERAIRAVASLAAEEVRLWLKKAGTDPNTVSVCCGIHPTWDVSSPHGSIYIQSVSEELRKVGYAETQFQPTCVAVVARFLFDQCNHAFDPQLNTAWLVIDFSARGATVSEVCWDASTAVFTVPHTQFFSRFSGHSLDLRLLLQTNDRLQWVRQEIQEAALLAVRKLKEQLSHALSRGIASAEVSFELDGLEAPMTLTETALEGAALAEMDGLADWLRMLADKGYHAGSRAQIIITGSGANLPYVQKEARAVFGQQAVFLTEKDVVAKGLALLAGGFQPAAIRPPDPSYTEARPALSANSDSTSALVKMVPPPALAAPERPPASTSPVFVEMLRNINVRSGPGTIFPVVVKLKMGERLPAVAFSPQGWLQVRLPGEEGKTGWVSSDKQLVCLSDDTAGLPTIRLEETVRQAVDHVDGTADGARGNPHVLVRICAIVGALIALGLSPFPFTSWPFLMAIEIFMLSRLATRHFGFQLLNSLVLLMIALLLGISALLSLGIGEVIGLVPVIGWVIKMLVAGLVIWGLGESAIILLKRIRSHNEQEAA